MSVANALKYLGIDSVISREKSALEDCSRLILPGVGAFPYAMDSLEAAGLTDFIRQQAEKKPLLGICLGMQMLFEKSYEYGEHQGLGLIPGSVVAMDGRIPAELNIPHIGWNALHFEKESPIFRYLKEGDCVYFVHSYFGADCADSVTATAEYGIPITAAVQRGNVFGCQFHPEKSGEAGLSILRAFCEMGA